MRCEINIYPDQIYIWERKVGLGSFFTSSSRFSVDTFFYFFFEMQTFLLPSLSITPFICDRGEPLLVYVDTTFR